MGLMSYKFIPPPSFPDTPAGFSASQVDMIRRNLRYETKIRQNAHLLANQINGGRPLLGRSYRRRPHEKLDFDGDGLRDMAVWEPPLATSPGSPGTFRVYTSSSGFANQITMSLGGVGDTPVPADYNGDGVTDFAVLLDIGGYGDFATMYWVLCESSDPDGPGGTAATHSCTGPGFQVHQWGNREDVPIPGTRFFPGSPGELTVFRPSTQQIITKPLSSGTQNVVTFTTPGNFRTQAPNIGFYDTDSTSDAATYVPSTGQFRTRLSTEGWATERIHDFCPGGASSCVFVAQGTGTSGARGGAVPAWGLQTMVATGGSPFYPSSARGALALWNPSDGTWNVMWTPLSGSTIEVHQWGDIGDIPIADGLGLTPSGTGLPTVGRRSDLAVYRSLTSTGPGEIHRCPFPSSTFTCPAWTSHFVGGGKPRGEAFAVADMYGDGKPELCYLDTEVMTVTCFTSDSSYASSFIRAFPSPAGVFL